MSTERPRRRRRQARYRAVAETLMAEIAETRFPVDSMLPTELELCERFKVSRYTVREALRQLEEAGLVERRQGSGTRVRARQPKIKYTQQLNTIGEFLQYPHDTRLFVHGARTITVGEDLAVRLHCPPRRRLHRISGVRRSGDGAPLCWTDVYVAPKHAAISGMIGSEPLPVYGWMEKLFDLRPRRVSVELFADVVDPEHMAQLGVEPGTPALIIVRRYFGPDNECFEISVSEHPAGRFTYSMTLEQEWGPG